MIDPRLHAKYCEQQCVYKCITHSDKIEISDVEEFNTSENQEYKSGCSADVGNHQGYLVLSERNWGYFIYPDKDPQGAPNICIAEVYTSKGKLFWRRTKKMAGNRRLYINKILINDVMTALLKLSGVSTVVDVEKDVGEKTEGDLVKDYFKRRRLQ